MSTPHGLSREQAEAVAEALLEREHESDKHLRVRVPFWCRSADSRRLHPRVERELYRQVCDGQSSKRVLAVKLLGIPSLLAVFWLLGSPRRTGLYCLVLVLGVAAIAWILAWQIRSELARLAREVLSEP
jgi:hypothetical protein